MVKYKSLHAIFFLLKNILKLIFFFCKNILELIYVLIETK
jgi:hypothetical protein